MAAAALFLPEGYPDSVAPEYAEFQMFDSLQAFCSYLRGTLTTHAMLQGAGVGDAGASALGATLNWILRDGSGMVGGLALGWWGAGRFDSDIKSWRLFADVINDVGLSLELCAPLVPPEYFWWLACAGTVCKAWCGVAAGATRATLTAHFARRGNIADCAAKEGSQETAVTLLGLVCGYQFVHAVTGSLLSTWAAFVALLLLHVYANYRVVRCLCLRTLNEERLRLVLDAFLAPAAAAAAQAGDVRRVAQLCSPEAVAKLERIVPAPLAMAQRLLPRWLLGRAARDRAADPTAWPTRLGCRASDLAASGAALRQLAALYYGGEGAEGAGRPAPRHMVAADSERRRVAVVLRASATSADVLQACLEAAMVKQWLRASPAPPADPAGGGGGARPLQAAAATLPRARLMGPTFAAALLAAGWQLDPLLLPGCGGGAWRVEWEWGGRADARDADERASG